MSWRLLLGQRPNNKKRTLYILAALSLWRKTQTVNSNVGKKFIKILTLETNIPSQCGFNQPYKNIHKGLIFLSLFPLPRKEEFSRSAWALFFFLFQFFYDGNFLAQPQKDLEEKKKDSPRTFNEVWREKAGRIRCASDTSSYVCIVL